MCYVCAVFAACHGLCVCVCVCAPLDMRWGLWVHVFLLPSQFMHCQTAGDAQGLGWKGTAEKSIARCTCLALLPPALLLRVIASCVCARVHQSCLFVWGGATNSAGLHQQPYKSCLNGHRCPWLFIR